MDMEGLRPINISFNGGLNTAKDPAMLPVNVVSEAVNIDWSTQAGPSKIAGRAKYNSTETGTGTPVRGMTTFRGENGTEYIIKACNGKLYYSKGDGVFSTIKFQQENVDVAVNTTTKWYNFLSYSRVVSTVQKKTVYCVTDSYPIATNTPGTNNAHCDISRALELYIQDGAVAGSPIMAKLIYYDDNNTRTAGSDELEVGASSTEIGWPKNGKYITKIFDRIVVANYSENKNGWIASEAQNGLDWTNSDGNANSGGTKSPEEYTGLITLGDSLIAFYRRGIMNIKCVPGAISQWREYEIPTHLGNVGNQIAIHSDGWAYFMSEEGVARTNGRMAELVDRDIRNNTESLGQLAYEGFTVSNSVTGDWTGGTIGAQQFDTSGGILLQKWQTSAADWAAGTNTNCDITSESGSVIGFNNYATSALTCTSSGDTVGHPKENLISQGDYWQSEISTGEKWVAIDLGADMALGYVDCWAFRDNCTKQLCYLPDGVFDIDSRVSLTAESTDETNLVVDATGETGRWIIVHFASQTGTPTSNHARVNRLAVYKPESITTQTIDYGTTPSALGTFTMNYLLTDTKASIYWQLLTSANGSSWTTYNIGLVTGGEVSSLDGSLVTRATYDASAITTKRYVRLKASFRPVIPGAITGKIQSLGAMAQWVSASMDFGGTPSQWYDFLASYNKNGGTIVFEANTSADNSNWDGYVTITPPSLGHYIPAIPLKRYVKVRITMTSSGRRFYTSEDMAWVSLITLSGFVAGTSISQPAVFSHKEKLYVALTSPVAKSYNDMCWIGDTRPTEGLALKVSPISGLPIPVWSKNDFTSANYFANYGLGMISGNSLAGFVDYENSGLTNRGTAFTSYITTSGYSVADRDIVPRYLYLYYRSAGALTIYYRYRDKTGGWSDWVTLSTTTIFPSNICRSPKYTIPSSLNCDFIEFKILSAVNDSTWYIPGMNLYVIEKPALRGAGS